MAWQNYATSMEQDTVVRVVVVAFVPADPPGVSIGERPLHGAPHPHVHLPHL